MKRKDKPCKRSCVEGEAMITHAATVLTSAPNPLRNEVYNGGVVLALY
jgi:hypothetical protein